MEYHTDVDLIQVMAGHCKVVESYKSDLLHDGITLAHAPVGASYYWMLRKTGTHLLSTDTVQDSFLEELKREHIAIFKIDILRAYNPDGAKLGEVSILGNLERIHCHT